MGKELFFEKEGRAKELHLDYFYLSYPIYLTIKIVIMIVLSKGQEKITLPLSYLHLKKSIKEN